MKTVYFILGMHRSGTSALGGVLNIMGLNVGSYLMSANETNPKGYFENRHVYLLNEKILKESNSSWDDCNFNSEQIGVPTKQLYINEAKDILENEFKYSQKFFIKDPRICLLFPIWESACKDLSINIKVIIPYRNPIEVAESLKSRNNFSYEKSIILWCHHFYQAEYLSRNNSRIFLAFDELLSDTASYTKKIEEFTGIKIDKASNVKINQFLEIDYKHINIPITNFSKEVPSFLIKTINLLEKSDFNNKKQINSIRNEFYYILELFHNDEIIETYKQLSNSSQIIKKFDKEAKINKDVITQQQTNIKTQKQKLEVVHVELEANKEKRTELNNIIKKLRQERNETNSKHIKIENKLAEHKTKRIELNKIIEQLRQERNETNSKHIKAESELKDHKKRLKDFGETVEKKTKEIDRLNQIIRKRKKQNKSNKKRIKLQKIRHSNEVKRITVELQNLKISSQRHIGQLTQERASTQDQFNTLSMSQKENHIYLKKNVEKTKNRIVNAITEYSLAWKNIIKSDEQHKLKTASNIKQFHALYTIYIGSHESERKEISQQIKKTNSSLLSYLNPFRLANLFARLNRLNIKLELIEKKFNTIPWSIIELFDEKSYLNQNIDVRKAILSGEFNSAIEHFILFGYEEIYSGNRLINSSSENYKSNGSSRSNIEDRDLFNHNLISQIKKINSPPLLQVRDVLINIDFSLLERIKLKSPNILSVIDYKEIKEKAPNIPFKPEKNISINRWLKKRGIRLHICEYALISNKLMLLGESKTAVKDMKKEVLSNDEQSLIEVYSKNIISDDITIVFSELKKISNLTKYIGENETVIVCYGLVYNQEIVQKIQPSTIVCVFKEEQHEIVSSKLLLPDNIQKLYKIKRVITKTYPTSKNKTKLKLLDIISTKVVTQNVEFNSNIESISASGIRGWIFNKKNKTNGAKIILHIIIDDEPCSVTSNSLNRKDVKKAYNIDCNSGFHVDLPTKFLDGKKYNIQLIAEDNNKHYLIQSTSFNATSSWMAKDLPKGKRVLFCTHNLRSQGAQNSLFELAIGLKRLYSIVPIIYAPAEGPLSDKYKTHGIKIIIDNSFNIDVDDITLWDQQISNFSKKLQLLNCDIVIANTLQTFYMIHVANNINIPSIWIPRESEPPKDYFNFLNKSIKNKAEKTFILASQLVFVSDATRRLWNFMEDTQAFKVIHNSLNTSLLNQDSVHSRSEIRKSFGIKHNDIVLLSLGTVSPRKGQLDFVKALPSIIQNSTKPIKAFIVGMGGHVNGQLDRYTEEIIETVEQFPSEVKKYIYLIPETDKQINTKTYDFYALADIFIFTSRIESFPRVILEALYFGLPIVATPCFGVVEQCIEDFNALYYNEEDISQLESHALQLIENEQKRKSFADGSKQLFENMQTYDEMLINYFEVIDNLKI